MDLFPAGGRGAAKPRPKKLSPSPETGILVTNHLNLMYQLAAGMLMPPSGFGGKHYGDPLADYPGWMPLFLRVDGTTANARRGAVRRATDEAAYLRPLLLEISLEGLTGSVHTRGESGWATRGIKRGIAADDWLLLAPAPLPACRIQRVLFRSAEERAETLLDAEERSNVPLADLPCDIGDTDWFQGEVGAWPPAEGPGERAATGLEAGRACGGALALLSHLVEEGTLPARLRTAAVGPDPQYLDPADILDTLIEKAPDGWFVARPEPPTRGKRGVLGKLGKWFQLAFTWTPTGPADDENEAVSSGEALLWKTVDRMTAHRREAIGAATDASQLGEQDARTTEDVLFGFLKDTATRLEGDLLDKTQALVATLDSLRGGLGGGTVSEMLERHEDSFSRAAILFSLRRRGTELVDLLRRYPQLTERDRMEAAILFGARDGWLGLPLELRGTPEFRAAVTHRMAELAHSADESGLGLGPPPG